MILSLIFYCRNSVQQVSLSRGKKKPSAKDTQLCRPLCHDSLAKNSDNIRLRNKLPVCQPKLDEGSCGQIINESTAYNTQ